MILRRFSQALRDQNWTTITIEFVLLVLGVFLGIQVANWNEERQFRAQERELLGRADIDRYNDYTARAGAIPQGYYFAGLYRSKLKGHAMLRDPRVKAKLVEYGFVAYWREKGWPSVCRPRGATDFECGLDVGRRGAP